MNSPLLALFVRSLREDARGRATYWTRGVLTGLLGLQMLYTLDFNGWNNAPGREFFCYIILIQLMALIFVGLSHFASAVAEEKEELTLGLLRMTGLSPLSILLGKSTARLCGALLLLAGQLPFTILAITLGGISLRQVIATYCMLGAFTFLLCNLALLGSVRARHTAGAAAFCVGTFALPVVFGLILSMIQNAARLHGVNLALDSITDAMWTMTPIARFQEIIAPWGFSGPPIGWQVASNVAIGAGCFLLAWAFFERFCDLAQDGTASPRRVAISSAAPQSLSSPPSRELVQVPALTRSARHPLFGLRDSRPPRAWKNALLWKDFYFICGGRKGFTLRTIGYGTAFLFDGSHAIFGSFPEMISISTNSVIGLTSQSIVPLIFSIDAGAMAARVFRAELRDQTLSTLAMLPCTLPEIVRRKGLAFLLASAPGACCSVAIQPLLPDSFRDLSNVTVLLQLLDALAYLILLLNVIAWLSLFMKRGAFPVGYVGTFIAYAGLLSFVSQLSVTAAEMWNFVIDYIVTIVAVCILYFTGIRRLETLASEN